MILFMDIKISDHFDLKRLLRYSISPISMMVFCSIYSIVDGLFVANFVGKNALASINVVYPLVMIIGAFGFMLGSGGNAEIAKTFGEGKDDLAREYFTTIIITMGVIGVVLGGICNFFLRPLSYLFGSSDLLIADCISYGRILLCAVPFFMIQNACQTLFSTAEKPKLGLLFTFLAGIGNIFFDFLFIVVLKFGVAGAALGTSISFGIGGFLPLIYFSHKNSSLLRFTKTKLYPKMLLRSCFNGISEMITNISSSIVVALMNVQILKLAGEDGISALSALFYIDFVFRAVMFGYCIASSPVIGFNYGAENHAELRNVYKISLKVMLGFSVIMFVLAQVLNNSLCALFSAGDTGLQDLMVSGMRLFALSYLFAGLNVYSSSLFTALCNGKLSGLISLCKGLVLPVILINTLPVFLKVNGVWLTTVIAEVITFVLSYVLIKLNKQKYHLG